MLSLRALEVEEFTWLFFEAKGGVVDRATLAQIQYPDLLGTKGVVIVWGRLPTWITDGAISYYRNRTQWQGRYDSELGGAVIIASFNPNEYPVGGLIEYPLPCLVCNKDLRKGAIYPYCKEHEDRSPARKVSRHKLKGV